MRYTLILPDYLPEPLNRLLRMHWRQRARKQRECDALVVGYARQADLPQARGRRRVSVVFRGGKSDPDARWKQLLDALVRARLLVDDSERWCELASVRNLPGQRETVIVLEECSDLGNARESEG